MFFGKEATMTIQIKLYASTFNHNGVKMLYSALMIWKDGQIVSIIDTGSYVSEETGLFGKGLELARLADQQKRLLEALGHEVEVDSVFNRSLLVADALEAVYKGEEA